MILSKFRYSKQLSDIRISFLIAARNEEVLDLNRSISNIAIFPARLRTVLRDL